QMDDAREGAGLGARLLGHRAEQRHVVVGPGWIDDEPARRRWREGGTRFDENDRPPLRLEARAERGAEASAIAEDERPPGGARGGRRDGRPPARPPRPAVETLLACG